MAIGIDFVLRANSTGFTQAIAKMNGALGSLKNGLKNFNVGNGLTGLLGVGGVIAGFRSVMNSAQDLRDELVKAGKPVDNITRSVAEMSDSFDEVVKGAKAFGVTALSVFTRAGEKAGDFINSLRGISKEQAKINAETEKAADDAVARRDASREANSPEKLRAARDSLADAESKESSGTRIAYLLEKEKTLRAEINRMGENTVARVEKEKELLGVINERKEINARLDKEQADDKKKANQELQREIKLAEEADKKAIEARKELQKKFAPNVEELAAQETGAFVAGDDPRLQARRIVRDEERARMLFNRGDIKGGMALAQQASDARTALENMGATGEGGMLTQQGAQQAFEVALTKTNEELATLTTAVQGIIKAQK